MAVTTTTLAVIAAVGAVTSAVGAIRAGNAAKNQADFQAKVAQNQATRAKQVAASDADAFRRARSRDLATLRSQKGELQGSTLLAAEDFAAEAEVNRLNILQGGDINSQRLNEQAGLFRTSGKNAQTSGFFRAGASLLKGAGTVAGRFGSPSAVEA